MHTDTEQLPANTVALKQKEKPVLPEDRLFTLLKEMMPEYYWEARPHRARNMDGICAIGRRLGSWYKRPRHLPIKGKRYRVHKVRIYKKLVECIQHLNFIRTSEHSTDKDDYICSALGELLGRWGEPTAEEYCEEEEQFIMEWERRNKRLNTQFKSDRQMTIGR